MPFPRQPCLHGCGGAGSRLELANGFTLLAAAVSAGRRRLSAPGLFDMGMQAERGTAVAASAMLRVRGCMSFCWSKQGRRRGERDGTRSVPPPYLSWGRTCWARRTSGQQSARRRRLLGVRRRRMPICRNNHIEKTVSDVVSLVELVFLLVGDLADAVGKSRDVPHPLMHRAKRAVG